MRFIARILTLLSKEERREAAGLIPLMAAVALLEVLGVASITPFLAVLADPSNESGSSRLPLLGGLLHRQGWAPSALGLGLLSLGTLLLTNALSVAAFYRLYRFAAERNRTISRRLLAKYLGQPYEYFLTHNTAGMGNNILQEVAQVVNGILIAGLQVLTKALASIAIAVMLIAVRPLLAAIIGFTLGGGYASLYILINRRLRDLGRLRVAANTQRFKAALEALAGVKELRVLGRLGEYVQRYDAPTQTASRVQAENQILAIAPRYAMELLAVGGLVTVSVMISTMQTGNGELLPILGLYGFAGFRLMPSLQMVFSGFASIRFSMSALEAIEDTNELPDRSVDVGAQVPGRIEPNESIKMENVSYSYPGADRPTVSRVSLRIPAGAAIALIGETGSGKTTIADLLLGLIQPLSGTLSIDGVNLSAQNVSVWQRSIGYVPQSIFLADDTIARNIALGLPDNAINMESVRRAARMARIHDFIESELRFGYDSVIGERGIRLSGGQRQRIGVARALYNDPPVLVLDEATSALDMITERELFEELRALPGRRTVIMVAHRLATVRNSDRIFLVRGGTIAAFGTFEELERESDLFREMVRGAPASR